jgi:hypothetical protein
MVRESPKPLYETIFICKLEETQQFAWKTWSASYSLNIFQVLRVDEKLKASLGHKCISIFLTKENDSFGLMGGLCSLGD